MANLIGTLVVGFLSTAIMIAFILWMTILPSIGFLWCLGWLQ